MTYSPPGLKSTIIIPLIAFETERPLLAPAGARRGLCLITV